MLTSKEIIERTGISRATLNNYIGSGLVPRPQVLPPGPEHGAAPRIGYFPDDTIERIEAIQRLKREGWSITRIAGHFAGAAAPAAPGAASAAATPAAAPATSAPHAAVPPQPAPAAAPRRPAPAGATAFRPGDASPALTLVDADHPAWLVDEAFRLVWLNEAARSSPLSPLALGAEAGGSVFGHLLAFDAAQCAEPVLRFHLEAARVRDAGAAVLFAGLPQDARPRLEALYRELAAPEGQPLVAQSLLPRAGDAAARRIHAVHFHEGVLFAVTPQGSRGGGAGAPAAPTLTPVAVLVATLQDAAGLWVRLAAEEYFELLNEVAAELDAIFPRHGGRSRRPVGEALVCCFLPGPQGSYLWAALAAAHEAREAMRQVSQRWQVRKGWDLELHLNIGIDEGQDWLGALGIGDEAGLHVLGDAADRAQHLSRCSRAGAILLTRNLVGKLSREQRQRLTYGAPRLEGTQAEAPLLFTFARLADVAAPGAAPPPVADLAVAELLDLHWPPSPSPGGTR